MVASLVLFTAAMAEPTHDVRILRNRAVVMLVIDVSEYAAAVAQGIAAYLSRRHGTA